MLEAFIIASTLVLFRCAAFVAFLPPVAGQSIPNTVKIGLAIALTIVLAPEFGGPAALELYGTTSGAAAWLRLSWLAARETILGASLAWLFGLCLVPPRIAGAYIAQEMGLTMAQITSAADNQQSNVVSQVFESLAVLMFFGLNLHHTMFLALGVSFDRRPLTHTWAMPGWDLVMYSLSKVEHQGFIIIAPIGLLMFAMTVTLLVTMRTAPQFNFMSYGMTLRLVVGMAAMVVFFPDIFTAMQQFMNHVSESVGGSNA